MNVVDKTKKEVELQFELICDTIKRSSMKETQKEMLILRLQSLLRNTKIVNSMETYQAVYKEVKNTLQMSVDVLQIEYLKEIEPFLQAEKGSVLKEAHKEKEKTEETDDNKD